MPSNLKKICDLINNKENIENEKDFKLASATLICDVVHNVINAKDDRRNEYCQLFQDRLNIPKDELEKIRDKISTDEKNIDEKIEYIKKELHNDPYQIMEFLKILNRFIILDGCNEKSYKEFEIIRDKFISDFY
ncbi:MAG TPA: hypothetical protein ENK99_06505 [Campylobacterales bacterium]|nr:hypothetical protein [Campylobacterales bacterium]